MTEASESQAHPAGGPPPPSPQAKSSRLYQTAAWVVIVAGIVFIVSVIFVAGAYLSNDGWRGHHHGPCMMQMGPAPSPMGPGPGFGPGPAGPGNGPAGPGGPHPMPPRP